MAENSGINWCEHTWNAWWGCQEILDPSTDDGLDPACSGCYARTMAENQYWWGKQCIFPVWGQHEGRRFFSEKHYLEPLKWNRAAEKAEKPARVFCMSMGDWAEGRPDQKPYLDKYLFPLVEQTPWLVLLLLTKRPQIAAHIVPEHWQRNGWPVNAWPGTTAVTQRWWDIRIPLLMSIPASRRFVSAEPLMEKIDARFSKFGRPDWVIVGGQSGKNAKPMHPDWARSMRNQCVASSVSFFVKQWGEWSPIARTDGINESPFGYDVKSGLGFSLVGKKKAGRLLDGREWNEVPGNESVLQR